MKLKNSLVLIAIAIFLLISIGSVCASENVTSDGDVQSADDGTDVVLSSDSDTDGNVADGNTNQDLTNTTTIPEKNKYEFKEDSANKTISVNVKDNKSNIDVNKNELSVMNGNKNISFEYNATIIKITETLPVGNYNLTIKYLGNAQYNTSQAIVAVKIFGNKTIETETSVVCNGKDIEVPVKVFDQVEYIELVKDNFNLTLVYTNETGNVTNLTISAFDLEKKDENNSYAIKFATNVKLISASLIINYANATEPKTVGIKVSTEVKAETDKDKFKSEEIKNISITIEDGKGNLLNVSKNDLKVLDNGNEITNFNYANSNITFELKAEGKHNITILYKGNESYNASNTTIEIGVYGANQIIVPEFVVSSNGETVEIPITIFNGLENITIDRSNMTMKLNYTDETGSVNIVTISNFNIVDGIMTVQILNPDYSFTKASLTIDYTNSTGAKTVKVNLLTRVDATPAKEKYRFNETNNITVKVFDYAGNPLNFTSKDLAVLDNGKNIQFTLVNTTMNVALTEGVHNLTIVYKGNETYNSSSRTIELRVYGDARINPSPSIILDEDENAVIFINLNDGADLLEINQTKLSITLFYTAGNKTFNKTVTGFTLNGQNVTFKLEDDFDSAYVDIKYDTNLTGNTTVKVNTLITANDTLNYAQGQVKNFTVEVKGTNGHAFNITDKNIQVLKDGKALNITVNGTVVTINDVLTFGAYNLTIKYLGTATYIESIKTVILSVYGINTTSTTKINSTKEGNIPLTIINGNETVEINATELNLTVTYKDGNVTKTINATPKEIRNGTLIFTLKDGNFTSAILNIKYKDVEANVTLNRVYNIKVEAINNIVEYQSGKLTYKITDLDTNEALANKTINLEYRITTGTISSISGISGSGITIISTISNTTDENGIVTFDNNKMNGQGFGFMDVGNSTVTIKSGQFNKTENTSQAIVINKANIKIVIEDYKEYYGSEKKIKITVTNAATGDPVKNTILHLYLPITTQKDYYFQTNENGTSEVNVNGFVGGTYDLTVSNNDTKNINNMSVNGSFTILKLPVVINAKDVTVYYNTGTTATIKITKDGKPLSGMYVLVTLYSSAKKYNNYLFQTNNKGEISFSASLTVGKHKMIINSADNRYEANQVTKTITVKKASGKLTAKKVTTYYKAGKYFTVKLTNTKKKKPIYDAKVNIKIYISKNRYYNYNGKTGMNGQIKLLLDSLKPGTYKVVISCADKKDYSAKQITSKIVIKKAPAKLTPKKVSAKKGAKKYFQVKVKNKKTKKAIQGVKVKIKVYTGKKAKTFTAKTNAKGIAKISTAKLKVGKHKVVVTSANKYVVAKKAKSTIKIKK